MPGGFGCKGSFNISSVSKSESRSVLRLPSSSTFSRVRSICFSSAAFCRASYCFRAASACAVVWPAGARRCVDGPGTACEDGAAIEGPALALFVAVEAGGARREKPA